MNTKLLLSLVFLAMLTLGSVCCKEEIETYYIDQEFKDYVVYNPGSYWIYEDTAAALTDSLALLTQQFYIDGGVTTSNCEKILQTFYSSLNKDTITGGGGAEGISAQFYRLDNPFLYNPLGYYPLAYAQSSLYAPKISFLDSLKVNNIVYKNVKVFNPGSVKFYWVKRIGMIRKDIEGSVWDLKKYHIN